MKKNFIECPFCKNEIREGAVKCQYCHEYLNKEKASSEIPWQTTEQTKAVKRKSRIVVLIWLWIIVLILIIAKSCSSNTQTVAIWQKVQERVSYFNNTFGTWPTKWEKLDKMECIWSCDNAEIAIYLNNIPDKEMDWVDEDLVAKWQAVNLTNEIGWKIAKVNVYVKWKLIKSCVASNGKVDYCEIDWKREYNQYYYKQ